MGSFSEKKMSEKKYDFLEDVFITISDKWHEKDRAINLNDNVRRNLDYLTYLLKAVEVHQETKNIEIDYTPFVAGYHYIVSHIDDFNTLVEISLRSYGTRAFTETPEAETGLNPFEFM